MQINNPFEMNDWEIKKFLTVVLAIQLAIWSVIALDAIGLQIPILRELIGFFYLMFIPGILILRILKLHKLGNIETILYTVGLSIATLMFMGLFVNTIFPFFGITGPITLVPLIITTSVIVLVLCVLSYVRDTDFSDPSFIDIKNVLSPPALFLCLTPFLAILGTYLVNFHKSKILLILLIVILAIIVLLIGFDKFIPKSLYPLAVFVIALSLLYHNSLISMHMWGHDIQHEYYLANTIIENAYWDSSISWIVNGMLSITLLAPIFSIITSMNLIWVFKIIYPLLFSLVPLGLYRVFQKQTDDKIAFLSCFFFVSIFTFYTELLAVARQEIAELFLVLLILLMIDRNMNRLNRSILFIIFGFSLVVSHYGLCYIYMFCLISAWLILVIGKNLKMQKEKPSDNLDITISSTCVLIFITLTLTWYIYTTGSTPFNGIVRIGDHITSSIFTDFLEPKVVQGLEMATAQVQQGILHEVHRVINYLNQIFIILGCIALVLLIKELKFEREYAAFSVVNLVILFAAVSVPFFASSINMTRMYQITLIFLAPFCVIGGILFFRILSKVVRVAWTDKCVRITLKILSVYFVIFMLFQTGFVYGVIEGDFYSISLDVDSKKDRPIFNEQQVLGAKWLIEVRGSGTLYADGPRKLLLKNFGYDPAKSCPNDAKIKKDSYIYTRIHEYIHSEGIYNDKNKIYANGDALVYYR